MRRIEELSDADVAEVEESAGLFQSVERTTADLRGVLDFLCGLRWQTAGLKKRALADVDGLLAETLGRQPSIAFQLLAHGPAGVPADTTIREDSDWSRFVGYWDQARSVANREGFLHWEVAFPGVWHQWQDYAPKGGDAVIGNPRLGPHQAPEGGFDAVIGNPPWDRIKLQEVEWFAIRDPAIARAPTACRPQGRHQAPPRPGRCSCSRPLRHSGGRRNPVPLQSGGPSRESNSLSSGRGSG